MVSRRYAGHLLVGGLLGVVALAALASCTTRCELSEEAVEAVLRTNLKVMRDVVGQYERDAGCLHDLEQLIAEGYLRSLPVDPFAVEGSAWLVERDTAGCICDVRSSSTATASDSSRYRDW